MKLIYIEWDDAHSSNGWHTKEDVEKFLNEIPTIKQVGWIFEETNRYIILVGRYAPANIFAGVTEDQGYGQIQRIPKTWIKKRIDLTKYIK